MLYQIIINKNERNSSEVILVEGKDSLKEIKSFLIARSFSESEFNIEKIKPMSKNQFKNYILKSGK